MPQHVLTTYSIHITCNKRGAKVYSYAVTDGSKLLGQASGFRSKAQALSYAIDELEDETFYLDGAAAATAADLGL